MYGKRIMWTLLTITMLLLTTVLLLPSANASITSTSVVQSTVTVTETTEGKVTICHRTGSGEYKEIEISRSALPAHLAHGDFVSEDGCPTVTTDAGD